MLFICDTSICDAVLSDDTHTRTLSGDVDGNVCVCVCVCADAWRGGGWHGGCECRS